MNHLDIRAILWGCAADIGGTFLFSLLFTMIATIRATINGVDAATVNQVLVAWSATMHGMIFSLFFGFFFTGVGGYVAARMAQRGGLLNSTVVGSIGILSGLLFLPTAPVFMTVAAIALSVPSAVIGGYLHTASWK